MGSFVSDLLQGEAAEQQLIEYLNAQDSGCVWIKGEKKSKFLDLICVHCGDMIEVKHDRQAHKTGNIAFEWNLFHYTKAPRVCYIIGTEAICWPISELKDELLHLTCKGKTRGLLGGDGWKNPMVLAPVEAITATATKYELGDAN